jgi:hypothetical protein
VPIFFGLKNFQNATSFFYREYLFAIFVKRNDLQKNHTLFSKIYITSIITTIDYNFEDTFENVFSEQFKNV